MTPSIHSHHTSEGLDMQGMQMYAGFTPSPGGRFRAWRPLKIVSLLFWVFIVKMEGIPKRTEFWVGPCSSEALEISGTLNVFCRNMQTARMLKLKEASLYTRRFKVQVAC